MDSDLCSNFKKGDLVIFNTIQGGFEIDGKSAEVKEIKANCADESMFPQGFAFRIQFEDNLRETWCRIDEITKVK